MQKTRKAKPGTPGKNDREGILMKIIGSLEMKNVRITRSFILSLLALLFLTGTTISASASGLTASREISTDPVYPGESFTVSVQIQAGHYLEAPALDENLPAGWSISPVDNDGAVFRESGTFKASTLEWVWVESLSEGEGKTVIYEVTVPPDSEPGTYSITGAVSAYSVSAVPVAGDSRVLVTLPPPEALFSASPLSGTAPLTVTFTDLSTGNPDSWEWDFEGDGVFDSAERNPSHTYETPGSYTVTLRASNSSYGSDTETRTGYVSVTEKTTVKTTSSGGGGGGGGGAGSPEPNSNIGLKEISSGQVFKGTHASYIFKAETNDIVTVEFDPKRSFGKTTAIVEMLKNTSAMVEEPAPGTVYKNMNIWVGNSGFSSPENLENAKISFRVNRTWIYENGINESMITLYRYNEEDWNSLSTSLIGDDENYLYFTSETPGFSPFAIAGREEGVQKMEIFPLESESQVVNGEKLTEEEKENGVGEKEGEEIENPASETEKEGKTKSTPGFEALFAAAGTMVSYAFLKKR